MTKITAEIGINHNGDIDIAKQLIDVAKDAGCDFVKFQKRTIEHVYTKEELDKPRESPWGTTNREQKEGLEFNEEQYDEIDSYCKEKEIGWYASPWDYNSVYFLSKYRDIPFIKVASASLTDIKLIEVVKQLDKPIILSTGMSTKAELDNAVSILGDQVEYILACTSTYPTKNEEMNLNFIKTLKEQYPQYKIGFSNHNAGIFFMCCSVAMGAEMIEFHITLDRAMYGSDQAASIEPTGVRKTVDYVRGLEVAMGTGEWTVYPSEEEIKKKLRKN